LATYDAANFTGSKSTGTEICLVTRHVGSICLTKIKFSMTKGVAVSFSYTKCFIYIAVLGIYGLAIVRISKFLVLKN